MQRKNEMTERMKMSDALGHIVSSSSDMHKKLQVITFIYNCWYSWTSVYSLFG